MQFQCARHFALGNVANSRHTTIRSPAIHLHKQHVNHRIERCAARERILNLNNFVTKSFTQLLQRVIIVGFFTIELVHCKENGFIQFLGSAENILSTHLNTILRVDNNNTCIGNAQCSNSTTYEVIGSGAVNYIEFLIEELGIEYSREYRIAIFFFYGEIVGYSVTCINTTSTFYYTTLVKHSFCESGFSGSFTTQ